MRKIVVLIFLALLVSSCNKGSKSLMGACIVGSDGGTNCYYKSEYDCNITSPSNDGDFHPNQTCAAVCSTMICSNI